MTQSEEMIKIIKEIMILIEYDYIGKENRYYKYFEIVLERLNKPHDLKKMVKELRGLFGGMGTFNDFLLHKDLVTLLIEENDRLEEQKENLFSLCEEILGSDFK
ncbi:hypothetical protein CC99x_012895 [Candidatus Berkiella cookevillensis]|uniref:DUF6966 domain-containing protein n=1 Tax=Candidatus Berkiella cookevillensis TaxID=437022 RepID=A0AAE3HSJ8_9GAMM|nr:hypothetical protein [Candidatus Berkiella cookevillensis]MCS5709797.1 hypothetical protein [Candidatus Berkiella cookevillensis]